MKGSVIMKANKIIAIIMAALLAAITFASCSGGGDTSSAGASGGSSAGSSGGAQKITIWAWDETFNIKAAEVAKEMYQKDNPGAEIEIVTMAQDDIVQKLHTSLSSGQTSGLPSIVLIEDYKAQNFLSAYPDAFEDLTDIVDESAFMDYKFAVNKIDDKIYGVPFDSGVAGLFYRTDYVEQAGYKQEDMQDLTWEKYIEIGKAVKEKTGHAMLTLDPSDIGQIRIMMQSAGSWYVKEDGQTVDIKDNQALKDGITVYKAMLDAGIVEQVSDWDSFVSAFQSGKVASVPTGCWIGSSVIKAEDQSGKWAIAPIPRLGENKDSVNYSSIGGSGWYVIKGVGDASANKDFLSKTFATSKELANQLAKDINLVSTLKAAKDTENYEAKNDFFGGQQIFKNFSEWSEKVPAVNYGLHTYAVEDIMTEAVQSIVGGADMQETLDAAQTQAEGAVIS
jgi:lactose/L-arabinose transport system substrate-binding protein